MAWPKINNSAGRPTEKNLLWEIEGIDPAHKAQDATELIRKKLAEAEESYRNLPAAIAHLKEMLAKWQEFQEAITATAKHLGLELPSLDTSPSYDPQQHSGEQLQETHRYGTQASDSPKLSEKQGKAP